MVREKEGAGREKYADKKIRPEGVWQTRVAESCLLPRFLDGEIDGKDRSLVGAYISREGGYGGRQEGKKEKRRDRERKTVEEEEEKEEESATGGKEDSTTEVSRLVTLVTERRRLAEKRRRIVVVRCSVIEKISLSLYLSARSNRESTCSRVDVCVQKKNQPHGSVRLYVVLQTKGKKKIAERALALAIGQRARSLKIIPESIGFLMKRSEREQPSGP